MEKTVMQLDFTELDQMIQVHGTNADELCLDICDHDLFSLT